MWLICHLYTLLLFIYGLSKCRHYLEDPKGINVSYHFFRSRKGTVWQTVYGLMPEAFFYPLRYRVREIGKTGPDGDIYNYELLPYPKNMLTSPLSSSFKVMKIVESQISKFLQDTLSIDPGKILYKPTTLETLIDTMRYSTENPFQPKKNEWKF